MSVVKTSYQTIAAEYNFANDSTGGAIGSISLGEWMPRRSVFQNCFIKTITAFASGGAATLSFTLVGTGTNITLLAATAFNVAPFNDVTNTNTALITNTPNITVDTQLTLVIGAAAITAGRVIIGIRFNTLDIA